MDDNTTDYLADGHSALVSGRVDLAASCVQQAMLLQRLHGKSVRERASFLDDLIRQRTQPLAEFNNGFNQAIERLRQRAEMMQAAERQDAPLATSRTTARLPMTQVQPGENRGNSNARDLRPYPVGDRLNAVPEQQMARSPAPRNTRSNAPTYWGPGGVIDRIDERYEVKDSAFFTYGRVLATLWHTSLGTSRNDKRNSWTHQGRFGEHVLSHIQRMVVVKEDHGSCWCVPINTYNGRGVAKFQANNRRDIEAHAIIFMSGTEATSPDWEHSMPKEPIQVVPAGKDQQLDEMSRINYAKVHTLEHNVKVMNVGKISLSSMSFFTRHWRAKVEEAPTRTARQTRR